MTKRLARLGAAVLTVGLVALAGPARADIHARVLGIPGDPASMVRAYVFEAGTGQKVTLIGPPPGQSQLRLADVASPRRPIVVAADFGAAKSPAGRGLFLMGGKAIAPFNFQGGFDSVVCIKNKKASILSTSDFRADPVQVTVRCDSAFQTFPRLIAGGRNAVSPLARSARERRIVLATKGPRAWVLIFPTPVNLFTVAKILSLPRRLGGAYEFDEAVSLSVNSDPAAYDYQNLLVGNPQRRAAAAIVVDD
ncbi:MAG TPA: hypothetical protein VF759_13295 [Allosphingosinicella sp.]|jgi:hypothetical protein